MDQHNVPRIFTKIPLLSTHHESLTPQKPTLLFQLFKLSRSEMTTISAITYLTSTLLPLTTLPVIPPTALQFLTGHLFIISTQLMVHFLGEHYDHPADQLNIHASRFTGGSRVYTPHLKIPTLFSAAFCAMLSLTTLFYLLPHDATLKIIALFMFIIASQYSAPPFLLNHRACGEITAALVTNILLPIFGVRLIMITSNINLRMTGIFNDEHFGACIIVMMLLALPTFLTKVALFTLLNVADRRPDWAAGKETLATKLGEDYALKLRAALIGMAYVVVMGLGIAGLQVDAELCVLMLLIVVLTGWPAWKLERELLKKPRPWRFDKFLGRGLMHSTAIVWVILIWAVVKCIARLGGKFTLSVQMVYFVGFGVLTLKKVGGILLGKRLDGKSKVDRRHHCEEEQVGLVHGHAEREDFDCHPPQEFSRTRVNTCRYVAQEPGENDFDVVIVGGGIGGLVAAATCKNLGLRSLLLEKRTAHTHDEGADLALWPSAIRVLSNLGIDQRFFEKNCFPVDTVDMCKLDYTSSSSSSELLKRIDMAKVVQGKGAKFVLVPRKELMNAIAPVVQDTATAAGSITLSYGSTVERVEEQAEFARVRIEYVTTDGKRRLAYSRVCIGADGARSTVRRHVVSRNRRMRGRGSSKDDVRFCNEVCYRGILRRESAPSELFQVIERHCEDAKMQINYGAGLRSSFGFMSADHSVAYWWVKTPATDRPRSSSAKLEHCTWPEPLKSLHNATPAKDFYVHAIEEGEDLKRWSTLHAVLIGDAAHVLSPNMGQGACLAIEDAFVFCLLLKEYWNWDDGHLEAMYEYERTRRGFVHGVRAETKKQLFLGQLKHPLLVKGRELLLKKMPVKVLEKKLVASCFGIEEHLRKYQEFAVKNSQVV